MTRGARRYSVRITQGAEEDLEALHDYLTVHRSPAEADGLLEALLARIETLETFPERGAVPQELAALGMREFRQLLFAPYRLIYRVVGGIVYIMVVADGRRDMRALLERRLLAAP